MQVICQCTVLESGAQFEDCDGDREEEDGDDEPGHGDAVDEDPEVEILPVDAGGVVGPGPVGVGVHPPPALRITVLKNNFNFFIFLNNCIYLVSKPLCCELEGGELRAGGELDRVGRGGVEAGPGVEYPGTVASRQSRDISGERVSLCSHKN